MSRLIVAGNYYGAHKPFTDLFKETVVLSTGKPHKFIEGDVLLLGGGEDISPTIYNQKPSRYCGADAMLSIRDLWEIILFNSATDAGCAIIGICRGAQMACALSGGSLYQHVTNHRVDHSMTTNDGEVMKISSVHHQMMNPENTEHQLLGWSTEVRSGVHLVAGEKDIDVAIEPEIVWFEKTKALAIQYHPEFMDMAETAVQHARRLVTTLVTFKE